MTQGSLQTAASSAIQDDPTSAPSDEQKDDQDLENKADDAISEETDLDEDTLFTRCIPSVKIKIVNADKAEEAIGPNDLLRMFPTLGPQELSALSMDEIFGTTKVSVE